MSQVAILQSASGGTSTARQIVASNHIVGSSSSSASFVAVTGASLAVTPTVNTHRVIVTFSFQITVGSGDGYSGNGQWQILRDSTIISDDNSGNPIEIAAGTNENVVSLTSFFTWTIVDSPATTSATTYSLKHKLVDGSLVTTSNISIRLEEIPAA